MYSMPVVNIKPDGDYSANRITVQYIKSAVWWRIYFGCHVSNKIY